MSGVIDARPLLVVSLDTSIRQLLKIVYCCSRRDRWLGHERTEAPDRNGKEYDDKIKVATVPEKGLPSS